ncbi:MAG: hypothetical protein K2X47_15175 [Bdellovibrionales bacterium]|nr:hypothetical protein [Bdellovibrionales bacterium]
MRRILGASAAFLALATMGMVGCSKSGSSASSSSGASTLTLAGTLSSTLAVQGYHTSGSVGSMSGDQSAFAVTLSELEIYGICFSTPPAIAQADVAASGSFSITLACAPGNAVTAIFRVKDTQTEVGSIVFEDTSKKDLNGNSKQSTSVVLNGDTNFGSIAINSDGKVVIPVTAIASTAGSTTVTAGTAFDYNGAWTFSAVEASLIPSGSGYVNAYTGCDINTGTGCNQPGIPAGMPITMLRLTGKEFTKNGSCNLADTGSNTFSGSCPASAGTTGTTDVNAVSIWEGPASGATGVISSAIAACGNKTGFTADEARAFAGVDLTGFTPAIGGTSYSYGRITFSAPSGFGGDTLDGNTGNGGGAAQAWMKTDATSNWPVMECTAKQVTGTNSVVYSVNYCKATAHVDDDNNGSTASSNDDGTPGSTDTPSTFYFANIEGFGGGCVGSDGKPLRVDNWGSLTSSTCTNTASPVTGINSQSCSYTGAPVSGAASQTFTCTFSNGMFTESGGNFTASSATNVDHSTLSWASLVAQGGKCKDIVTGGNAAKRLAQYKCYANAYFQNGGGGGGSGCSTRFNFNWNAVAYADFVIDEGRGKPRGNFMTNVITYSPDGSTMFINDEQDEYREIRGSGSSSVRCNLGRTTKIVMKKVADNKLLFDMQDSTRLKSTDAACRASANAKDSAGACLTGNNGADVCQALKEGNQKQMAYLTKI